MLTHTLLTSWHFRNSSDRIPSEGPLFPTPSTQCRWEHQSTCKSYLCECTSHTGNNSFERTTWPCLLLRRPAQRALCFSDCVWAPVEKIPVTSLCHPLPLHSPAPGLRCFPRVDLTWNAGLWRKGERRGGKREKNLRYYPWFLDSFSHGPCSETCHILTFIRKNRVQSCL